MGQCTLMSCSSRVYQSYERNKRTGKIFAAKTNQISLSFLYKQSSRLSRLPPENNRSKHSRNHGNRSKRPIRLAHHPKRVHHQRRSSRIIRRRNGNQRHPHRTTHLPKAHSPSRSRRQGRIPPHPLPGSSIHSPTRELGTAPNSSCGVSQAPSPF